MEEEEIGLVPFLWAIGFPDIFPNLGPFDGEGDLILPFQLSWGKAFFSGDRSEVR